MSSMASNTDSLAMPGLTFTMGATLPYSSDSAPDEDYELVEEDMVTHSTPPPPYADTANEARTRPKLCTEAPSIAFDDGELVRLYDADHQETVDGDFHFIDGEGVPTSRARMLEALPTPAARQVDNTARQFTNVVRAVASTPNLLGRAASAAGAAVKTELMNTSPAKLSLTALAWTGIAAGFAVMVDTTMQTAQGIKPTDHEHLFEQVDNRLRRAGRGFSEKQKTVVEGWIADAKKGLQDYATNNYSTLAEAASSPAAQEDEKKAGGGRRSSRKTNNHGEAGMAKQETTFGTLLHGSAQVSASRNPSIEALQEGAPELARTLLALHAFLEMPCKIQTISSEQLQERKTSNPLFGATAFTDELSSRASIFFENAMRAQDSQLKKNYIASSSPGTGKTLNIEKVARWLKQPIVTLTGADFNNVRIENGKTAWDAFDAWVKDAVVNHMRLAEDGANAVAYINGFLLLDDFHFALEGNGHFARDRESRTKFRNFLKDLADPAREHVLSDVELAPGRSFPVNTGRIQAFMTLNRLPDDFDDAAEEAFRSRTVKLKADSYPTDEDRSAIAANWALTINRALAQEVGMTTDEFGDLLDKGVVADSLQAIADKDIEMAEPFGGRLGVRGLADMLSLFQSHVKSNVEMAKLADGDYSRVYSLEGFGIESNASSIGDYKKCEDSKLVRMAEQQKLQQRIATIRSSLPQLNKDQRDFIESMLSQISGGNVGTTSSKDTADAAERQLEFYRDRVSLPDVAAVRAKLLDKFGYLKSTGEGGEIDRFAPVYELVGNLYFRRAAAFKNINEGYERNQIVRVTLTDPSAWDTSFFDSLVDTLGGIPYALVVDSTALFTTAERLPTVNRHDKIFRDWSQLDSGVNVTYNNGDRETADWVKFRSVEADGRCYVYAKSSSVNRAGEYTYFVSSSGALQSIRDGDGDGDEEEHAAGPGTGFHTFRSTKGFVEEVRLHAHPRPNLIQHVLEQTRGKRSCAESMMVVVVDDAAMGAIYRWADASSHRPPGKGHYDFFEEHMYNELNASGVTLRDGSRFDARSLTLCLLHVGTATTPTCDDSIVHDLLLGPPPVEGRRSFAESTLRNRLRDAVARANCRKRMLKLAVVEAGELTGVHKSAFEKLLEFDRQLALRSRGVGYTLPTAVLQQAITILAGREAAQLADHFGILAGDESAEAEKQLAALTAELEEVYGEHTRIVGDCEEMKRKEARELAEAEARARARAARRLEEEAARPASRRALDAGFQGTGEARLGRATGRRPAQDDDGEDDTAREAAYMHADGDERRTGREVQLAGGAVDDGATDPVQLIGDASPGAEERERDARPHGRADKHAS